MGDDLPYAVRFVCYHAGQFKAGRPVIHQHHRDVLPLKLSDQGRLGVSPQNDPFNLLALGGALPFVRRGDHQLISGVVGLPHHALADAGIKLV